MVIGGLIVILLLVLVLPFVFHKVEENLEVFLFIMGVAAAFISGEMTVPLLISALEHPIMIASAVFIAGALFYLLREYFARFMDYVFKKVPVPLVVFLVVVLLGFLSSVITAIIASIILVEIIFALPVERRHKIVIVVLACFSIGLGAALTPIGEPLATIAIAKLNEDFFYLLNLLGRFIIPGVVVFGLLAAGYVAWAIKGSDNQNGQEQGGAVEEEIERDTWKGIIIRAIKVYLFVMALTFLGEGFKPLIETYILNLDYRLLYWINTISAVLDNATLAAAEISPAMDIMQIEAILMGLIIAGGMLIPGNIPNIIAASKLRISSTEWAKIGIPIGAVSMVIFYLILF